MLLGFGFCFIKKINMQKQKMKNKVWIFVGAGIILLLLVGGLVFSSGILNANVSKNFKSEQTNPELEKYRSDEIPEDCRLPEYESDIEWWKQHLSHHEQTWYCLEYYGTSIEELNGDK